MNAVRFYVHKQIPPSMMPVCKLLFTGCKKHIEDMQSQKYSDLVYREAGNEIMTFPRLIRQQEPGSEIMTCPRLLH